MVRVQVRLTECQTRALRRQSGSTGRSISDLVREAVEGMLGKQVKRGLAVAGMFSSGHSDVSTSHDEHLSEAFWM